MELRRFIAFLMISLAAMLFINTYFPAAKPPAKQVAAQKKDGDKNVAKADADQGKAGKAADEPADEKDQAAAKPQAEVAVPVNAGLAVPAKESPLAFASLGSLSPDGDYRMLVTVSSAGASVVRAEMTSDRFRDQHNWSGYLGDLELTNAPTGGALVNVVGPGTPAAEATADGKPAPLAAGEVIVAAGEAKIQTAEELRLALAATQPGQTLTLQVKRGDDAPQNRTVRLMRKPFAVVRPEAENYEMRGVKLPANFYDQPSFLVNLATLDNNPISKNADKKLGNRLAELLEKSNWELSEHDESSATFRRDIPELKLEVLKRYTLEKVAAEERGNADFPAYNLRLTVELRNVGDAKHAYGYQIDGPTGMPIEGWWYSRKIRGGLRDVAVRFADSAQVSWGDQEIAKGKVEPVGDGKALAYAGVDGHYFAAVLIPQIQSMEDVWFDNTEAIVVGPKPDIHDIAYTNVTCRLTRRSIDLAPQAVHKDEYVVFIGPKRGGLLDAYYPPKNPEYSLRDLLYYGWPIFAAVAHVMSAVLHFFYGIVGNYGIAIVMLTVLVRGLMFPISYKQTQNMARLQALKPEMDRINEKYKNDMQKKSQATTELYRKNKINPLAGCLPLFLQLPVFMGLYRALLVDVELRQSPLFGYGIRWCSNLAAPDMLWNWSHVVPDMVINYLGPYLNVLPLVTVALFLVTQKMAMPPATSPDQEMQQRMMKYVTMFMGLMFYKVPSGLCIYFIASSLWGIGERKLLPKPATTTDSSSSSSSSSDTRPSSNGNGSSKKADKAKKKNR